MTEHYVKHSIEGVKMGVGLVFGHDTLAVYDVIRALCWYSREAPRNVDSKLGKTFVAGRERGLVAAPTGMGEIATMMGWKSRTSVKLAVRKLKEQGWIQVELLDPLLRQYIYIVGERVADSSSDKKRVTASFFSESWVGALYDKMQRRAESKYETENVNPWSFTFEQRCAITQDFYNKRKARFEMIDEEEDAA